MVHVTLQQLSDTSICWLLLHAPDSHYNAELVLQMLQEEGKPLEDAEQRVNQVSCDMQAIIGMQL